MADCLIVGFNDLDFPQHEERVRRMGVSAGAYADLALSFVRHEGRPLRALEVLNHFRTERAEASDLHNVDFLWPVILVLATSLHRHGHSFDFVNLPHRETEAFRQKLAAPDLKAVVLTSTLYTEPKPLTELVEFVRAHRSDVTIIIGGPYIAGQAKTQADDQLEDQLRYLGGDIYVISAEGETALAQVVGALKTGTPLEAVNNLAIRRGDRFVFTPRVTEYNNLAETMVDYTLFPRTAFNQFVTTRTAKSCPFACAFCGFPERAGEYTYLSVDDVEKELRGIAELGGITTLTIIDDTFNVPKPRFKELLRMMIRNKFGFRWNSFFRSDHGDDETIDLMAQAGCEGVILGTESGSDTVLKAMNKTAKRRHYASAIPRLQSHGIDCYASFIVGFPGETRQTLDETIDLIETAKPTYFRAQLWYADPITPVYRQRLIHRLHGEGFHWKHGTMDVAQACEHINRMFLAVENSIWQPQAGFEFWSTFYLQRHGMGRERLHAFMRAFNAGIKEKLLRPHSAAELSSARAHDLAELAELSARPLAPFTAEVLSGAAYVRAETYWLDAIRALAADERTGLPLPEAEPSTAQVSDGGAGGDSDAASCLAALAVVVAVVQGGWRTLLLGQDGAQPELLPLQIAVDPALDFTALVAAVELAQQEARVHRSFGLPLLRNVVRLRNFGVEPPRMSGALLEGAGAQTFLDFPSIRDELRVTIARDAAGAAHLTTRLGLEKTAELAGLVRALLARRGEPIRDVVAWAVSALVPVTGTEATFNFA